MIDALKLDGVRNVQPMGLKKTNKFEDLPQATNLNSVQKDTFVKQNKLNSICALTDGYATPAMV